MARLALDVLGRPDLTVLVCGYRRTPRRLPTPAVTEVAKVCGQDLATIADEREFVGSGPAGGERYDIVVAADVIECFGDPQMWFAKLFGLVVPDGVLICSASLYDARDLQRRHHHFADGHLSHYTPKTLRRIAHAHDYRVDFRLPAPENRRGKRRRYVIFSRSEQVMDAVSDYFGRHRFAPPDDAPAGVV